MFSSIFNWVSDVFVQSPLHLAIEVGMVFLIFFLLSQKSYRPPNTEDKLTKEEEDELINEWTPKPLVNPYKKIPSRDLVLDGKAITHCKINGEDYLNLLSTGVLGLQAHPDVIEVSGLTARKYGVGSCGPRAFYGSLQPHIDLEDTIAKFLGVPAGILYTSEFQAISTLLPAFLKAGDILILDKGVSFAFSNGIQLCKCNVKWFDHHNLKQFEEILSGLKKEFELKQKRVYVAIEAITINTGDLYPLDKVMALKKKYPFRLILEESFTLGVLGKTGRGITEHFGINPNDVDIIVSSIGNSIGGMGAIVLGDKEMCDHQRLNATGYIFSCALPPFLSQGAIKAFEIIDNDKGKMISELKSITGYVHELLSGLNQLSSLSSKESPFIHLVLKNKDGKTREEVSELLDKIVRGCEKKKIIFGTSAFSDREKFLPQPTIKISVPYDLTREEAKNAIEILNTVANEILGQ